MSGKIIFVKHTSTFWDKRKKIKGQTDIELNKKGEVEARELAGKILKFNIDRIFCSDLKRCKMTADIILKKINVPVVFDRRLRECNFGNVEGLTKNEAIEKFGESIIEDWEDQTDKYDFRKYSGEFRDDVLRRHVELLEKIRAEGENDVVLIIGHSRGLNTLLSYLGHEPILAKNNFCII